ncbi:hypothetical protein B4U80_08186 [Leptotrombidium deliense]|uniref:Uncharacterized protein n=1 Tax=Leptotrombidium deliense TaxID=299467 RepID=A0A443S929_9ACAR|nr:hypothetical protein B4U80_08186 [Leptotrombidium deliense]
MCTQIPRELLPIKYGGTFDKDDPKLF